MTDVAVTRRKMGPDDFHKDASDEALRDAADLLIAPTVHFALGHSLVYADKDNEADPSRAGQCPVAMLPVKTPKAPFKKAANIAPLWNELVDKAARDVEWLYSTLAAVVTVDDFTKRLVDLCRVIHENGGPRQRTYLGIHRSDYMLHDPPRSDGDGSTDVKPCFLQVELNTIASSMGAHAANVAKLHSFILERHVEAEASCTGTPSSRAADSLRAHFGINAETKRARDHLPDNQVLCEIPAALAAAHTAYGGGANAVVLMVVSKGELNFADQRGLEWALWERHQVRVERRTFLEIADECTMDTSSGKLTFKDGTEVSVVYYRSGYGPECYGGEQGWSARRMLEESLAIKCPSVAYQLVGAKKIQQALAAQGVLERFLDPEKCAELRPHFAGLWGLGPGEDDEEVVAKAIRDPTLYVLKPQREGGGYNFYGDQVAEKLRAMSKEDRGEFILMQRIQPRPQSCVLTRKGTAYVGPSVSEYGFYSVFLGDGSNTGPNLTKHAGHLVRSKAEGVDEGGVAAGYAVISSPFLID